MDELEVVTADEYSYLAGQVFRFLTDPAALSDFSEYDRETLGRMFAFLVGMSENLLDRLAFLVGVSREDAIKALAIGYQRAAEESR